MQSKRPNGADADHCCSGHYSATDCSGRIEHLLGPIQLGPEAEPNERQEIHVINGMNQFPSLRIVSRGCFTFSTIYSVQICPRLTPNSFVFNSTKKM